MFNALGLGRVYLNQKATLGIHLTRRGMRRQVCLGVSANPINRLPQRQFTNSSIHYHGCTVKVLIQAAPRPLNLFKNLYWAETLI